MQVKGPALGLLRYLERHGVISMKELVEYIARNLVDNPDAVEVHEQRSDYVVRIELTVDPEETGKVIGREGKIARAMRTLVNAGATREGRRGVLEID